MFRSTHQHVLPDGRHINRKQVLTTQGGSALPTWEDITSLPYFYYFSALTCGTGNNDPINKHYEINNTPYSFIYSPMVGGEIGIRTSPFKIYTNIPYPSSGLTYDNTPLRKIFFKGIDSYNESENEIVLDHTMTGNDGGNPFGGEFLTLFVERNLRSDKTPLQGLDSFAHIEIKIFPNEDQIVTDDLTGAKGPKGSVWRTGTGVPDNTLGVDQDFYLDSLTGNYYEKVNSAYVLKGTLSGGSGGSGHTHSNLAILDATDASFTTILKSAYDAAVTWITTNGASLIAHLTRTDNPHNVTKAQVGLGSVPNIDTTAAVTNQHTHSNKALLDTYTQKEANIADAVSKKHNHANQSALDNVSGTNTGDNATNSQYSGLASSKEDSANKSTLTSESASTTKFPVWSAIVAYFTGAQIRSLLGISTLSGSNTGDETTATIQSKRPLKTVNSITLEGSGNIVAGGLSWSEVTGTTQTAAVNNGYILNNASLVTLTLPTTASIGDIIRVVGKGAGGWRISQPTGDIIHFGNLSTTTGTSGYLSSTHRRDCVELACVTANTDWQVIDSQGNITVF